MGHRHGVERHGEAAEGGREPDQQGGGRFRPGAEQHAARGRAESRADDHEAPVDTVGDQAERPLCNRTGERRARDEVDQIVDVEAAAAGEDGPQRPERAVDEADAQAPHKPHRREAPEARDVETDGRRPGRLRRLGQRYRNQRDRDENGDQREQLNPCRVVGRQQELPGHQHAEADEGVGRHDGAAVGGGGAVVQPTLDHDVEAGEREAHEEAQHAPGDRVDQEDMGERRGGDDAGKRREGPDVADTAHDEGHVEAAEDEAREIDSAEQADLERREGLDLGPHGQERVDQPVAGEEDCRAEQQRGQLPKRRGHGNADVGWRCRRGNTLRPGSGGINRRGQGAQELSWIAHPGCGLSCAGRGRNAFLEAGFAGIKWDKWDVAHARRVVRAEQLCARPCTPPAERFARARALRLPWLARSRPAWRDPDAPAARRVPHHGPG